MSERSEEFYDPSLRKSVPRDGIHLEAMAL